MEFDKTGDVQVNAVVGTGASGDRSAATSATAAAGGGGMPSYMAFVILVSGVVGGLILVVAVIMLCKHCSPRHKQQQRGSQELMLQNPVTKSAADDTPNCSVGCGERCLTRPNQPAVPVIKVCSTDAECCAKQSSKIEKAALPGLGRPADPASYKTSLSELAQREEGVQRLSIGACEDLPASGVRRPSSIVILAESERSTTAAVTVLQDCSRSCDAITRETQVMEAADRRSGGINNGSNSSSCSSVDAEIATLTKLPSAMVTRQATRRPQLQASAAGGIVHQPIGSLSQTSQSTIHSSMDSADNRSEITVIEAYVPSVATVGATTLTPPRLAASVRDDGGGRRSKSFAGQQQNERWPSKARSYLSQDSAHYGAAVTPDSVMTSGIRIATAAAAKADGGFGRVRPEGGECRGLARDPSPRRDSVEFAITPWKSPASGNDREWQSAATRTDASTSTRPQVLPLGASPAGHRGRAMADGKTSAAVAPTSRSRSGDGDLGQQQHAKRGWAASDRAGGVGALHSFDGFQSRSFETQALVHHSPVAVDVDAGTSRSTNAAMDRRPVLHCNGGGGDGGGSGGGKKRAEELGRRASHELSQPATTERGCGGDGAATGGGGSKANCQRSPSASGEVGNRALWVLRSAIELEGRDLTAEDHAAQPEEDQDAAASVDLGSSWRTALAPCGGSSSSLPSKQSQAQMTSLPLSSLTTGPQSEQDGGGSRGGIRGRGQLAEERSGSSRSNNQHWEEQRIIAALAEMPTSETSSSRRARFQSFLVSRARTRLLEVQSSTDRSLDDSFDTVSMTEGGTASESSRKNTTSFDSSSTTGAESSTSELPIRLAAAAAASAASATPIAASAAAVTTTTVASTAAAAAGNPAAACRDASNDDLRTRRKSSSMSLTSKKRRDFQKGRWRSSLDESDCSDTLEDVRPRAGGSGFAVGGLLRIARRGGSGRGGSHDCHLPARDYSIDEKTDAIFREFVRIDPAYESKQFPCSGGSAAKRAQRFTKRYFSDGGGASAEAFYGGNGTGCSSADGGCLVGAVGLVNLTEEDASEL